MRHTQKGFTLIELFIVIMMVAIICCVGLSAYDAYRQPGSTYTDASAPSKASYLVCKDSMGSEVSRDPSIPGATWSFENGVFVTTDYNGNPVTYAVAGQTCSIE